MIASLAARAVVRFVKAPITSRLMIAPTRTSNAPTAVGTQDLTALMTQLAGGDTAALEQLYSDTVGIVYARALRITGNVADAEEVTCDVYREAWQKAKQFDPQRGTPIQWLMVIARSRALDYSRRRRAHIQGLRVATGLYESHAAPGTDDVLYQCEMFPVLRATLLRLSSVQARMIGLAFFDGLTHREISVATRMPLGTVKSHLGRALLVLRKAMKAEYESVSRSGVEAPLTLLPRRRMRRLPLAT